MLLRRIKGILLKWQCQVACILHWEGVSAQHFACISSGSHSEAAASRYAVIVMWLVLLYRPTPPSRALEWFSRRKKSCKCKYAVLPPARCGRRFGYRLRHGYWISSNFRPVRNHVERLLKSLRPSVRTHETTRELMDRFWLHLVLENDLKHYCDLFFGLYPSSLCFVTTTFRGMAFPSLSGEPNLLGPIDRATLYRWTTDDEGSAIPRNVVITIQHHRQKHLEMNMKNC
jgi:hypothetical protein